MKITRCRKFLSIFLPALQCLAVSFQTLMLTFPDRCLAVFLVTRDDGPAAPGSGGLSLRHAIESAQAAGGHSRILFDDGVTFIKPEDTITINAGVNITIDGDIDGDGIGDAGAAIFNNLTGVVSLTDVSIGGRLASGILEDGQFVNDSTGGNGGASGTGGDAGIAG